MKTVWIITIVGFVFLTSLGAFAADRNGSKGDWFTGELTEKAYAPRWGYGATDQGHINAITAEEEMKQTGDALIKFYTETGFDTWLFFPNTKDLDLDCTKVSSLSFQLRSENKNGWGPDVWVIIKDMSGRSATCTTLTNRAPQTLKEWVSYSLPIGPDAEKNAQAAGWKIEMQQGFDWKHVGCFEFHEDTGGYGFVLYFDDMKFSPTGTEPVKWWLSSLEKPDLTITYAERIPRYHRYSVGYENVYPELSEEQMKLKHWPSEGEQVKYLVHVRNEGFAASKATDFVCTIDGKVVKKTTLEPIKAKSETIVEVPWNWKQGAFIFDARVDTGNRLDEISKKNNFLEFQTDAYTLFAFVEKKCAEKVSQVNNGLGSFSFEDWLRFSTVNVMNMMMRESTYDFAPKGTRVRCRIDGIIYVDSVKDIPTDKYPDDASDGRWSYPEGSWIEYCNLSNTYMWALNHELTHQLGIIDDYQLDLGPQGNLVNGKGFGQPDGGSMGGGRTNGRRGAYYADMDIAGYEATYGHRRGYFGEYLWNVPDKNTVSMTIAGKPVPNAEISVYQKKFDVFPGEDQTDNGKIPNKPIMTGKTDAQGKYTFENRPVPKQYTTDTGCTLKPNPFGYIDVVGRNGVLMLRANVGGKFYYGFMDIGQFNVEFARGHKQQGNYELKLLSEEEESKEQPK